MMLNSAAFCTRAVQLKAMIAASLQIKGGLFAALLPLFPHGLPVSGKERQTSVKHGNRG